MDVAAQRTEALAKANEYRLAVAAKRREFKKMTMEEATAAVADLIESTEDPALLSGRVAKYLDAIPRRGVRYVAGILRDMDIRTADKKVGDLTSRQRCILAGMLRGDS